MSIHFRSDEAVQNNIVISSVDMHVLGHITNAISDGFNHIDIIACMTDN